jgi:hypothetical protein
MIIKRGPKFHASRQVVKRHKDIVAAKQVRIAELVAQLSRCHPNSRDAIDLRRKIAKARYQLSIMTSFQ